MYRFVHLKNFHLKKLNLETILFKYSILLGNIMTNFIKIYLFERETLREGEGAERES